MKFSSRICATLLPFLLLPQIVAAHSDWQATTVDGTTHPEIYRLNGNTDTLVSAPGEWRTWRQFHLSEIRELRKVYSDAWWYMPAATAGLGTAAMLIDGRALDDGLVAIAWFVVVGGTTAVAATGATMLATDEVHDLDGLSMAERERIVGARIPIAFGSPREGITRLDPASPPGRRISSRSGWGGASLGHISWSDGFGATTLGGSAEYWLEDHLLTARYRFARDLSITRGTVALLYGRGVSFERAYGMISMGAAYEYSVFDPAGPAQEAFYPLFNTAGLVLDGEFVWPVSSWLGLGFAANTGFSFEGAYWGMTFSILAGDLE